MLKLPVRFLLPDAARVTGSTRKKDAFHNQVSHLSPVSSITEIFETEHLGERLKNLVMSCQRPSISLLRQSDELNRIRYFVITRMEDPPRLVLILQSD